VDSRLPLPQTVATKPYDWTYTTTYAGSSDDAGPGSAAQWTLGDPANAQHTIPIAELSRPDPILFYAEIPLFEDELHDNGASHLLVRIVRLLSLLPQLRPLDFDGIPLRSA
jgi:type 2A phosphatase activator TIP41